MEYIELRGVKIKIDKAQKQDLQQVLELYRLAIGEEGCTWSLDYPNEKTLKMDFENENLFVMKSDKDEIISSISIDKDEAVNKLTCWSKNKFPAGELSRLVVRRSFQNNKLAPEMIKFATTVLKERGYKSVHYLVSKTNYKAIASYKALDFVLLGETFLFEKQWLCYEKEI